MNKTYLNEGMSSDIKSIHSHPEYNRFTMHMDVAVVETDGNLVEMGGIPIAISYDGNKVLDDYKVQVSGWGALGTGGAASQQLRSVIVKINTAQCRRNYGNNRITQSMFCASDNGKDSCQGDSGGPAVNGNTLVGIVSWGLNCADVYYPGVYTAINKVGEFIKKLVPGEN